MKKYYYLTQKGEPAAIEIVSKIKKHTKIKLLGCYIRFDNKWNRILYNKATFKDAILFSSIDAYLNHRKKLNYKIKELTKEEVFTELL